MCNIKSKFLSILVLTAMVLALFAPVFSITAFAAEGDGFIPSAAKRVKYSMAEVIADTPRTFEATVKIATNYSKASTILSSYFNGVNASFVLAIDADGHPYLQIADESNKLHKVTFDEVDLRTGEWEHLSVVLCDEENTALCYVNGELASNKSFTLPDITSKYATIIGGSYYNNTFFNGSILNVALFSGERSATDIASDFQGTPSGEGLLCYYNFAGYDNDNYANTVNDLSGNGNHLSILEEFYDEPVVELDEYAYSMALVGDVQKVNRYAPENLAKIYDWLLANKEDKKIAFAMNLGDLTDRSTVAEWANIKTQLHRLDGILPYSIVRGNHDYISGHNGTDGFDNYKNIFPYEDYVDLVDGVYNGNMLNSYQTFEVSGNKYLVLNLDIKNSDGVIEWANEVVATHHDYNVIVTTHMHITGRGELIDETIDLAPTSQGATYNCDELWDIFFSKHKNIFMIVSGHVSANTIVTSTKIGDQGNTVTQILVDPQGVDDSFMDQGGVGIVAMLYFSADGKSVQTQFYSTIQEKYYLSGNEFRIELDPVQTNGVPTEEHHNLTTNYDKNGHWSECLCGVKKDEAPHEITWTIMLEATPEKDGRRRADCACGYSRVEKYSYEPPEEDPPEEPINGNVGGIVAVAVSATAVVAGGATGAIIVIKKKKTKK